MLIIDALFILRSSYTIYQNFLFCWRVYNDYKYLYKAILVSKNIIIPTIIKLKLLIHEKNKTKILLDNNWTIIEKNDKEFEIINKDDIFWEELGDF